MATAMKFRTVRFKNLSLCLKELEPFVRSGTHLRTGRGFKRFDGLRSRELLGNWLLCVTLNFVTTPHRFIFTSDPSGGDGIIFDTSTENTWPTEHIFVPPMRADEKATIEELILKAIDQKRQKGGAAYASGKTLVVFLDSGGGVWFPNKVARSLPKPLLFDAAWVVGLHAVDAGEYSYDATCLDLSGGAAPAYRIQISKDFDDWTVQQVQ